MIFWLLYKQKIFSGWKHSHWIKSPPEVIYEGISTTDVLSLTLNLKT